MPWLLGVMLAVLVLYLRTIFATHEEVSTVQTLYAPMPVRVDRLEGFAVRQEAAQAKTDSKMELISLDVAVIKSSLLEQDKKMDRMLRRLEGPPTPRNPSP